MANIDHATDSAYSPEMDGPTHEATYRGFVSFVEIATGVVICWVLSLAVGGVREAWITAIVASCSAASRVPSGPSPPESAGAPPPP